MHALAEDGVRVDMRTGVNGHRAPWAAVRADSSSDCCSRSSTRTTRSPLTHPSAGRRLSDALNEVLALDPQRLLV